MLSIVLVVINHMVVLLVYQVAQITVVLVMEDQVVHLEKS